jgi:ketosteroid isomerase-like protein
MSAHEAAFIRFYEAVNTGDAWIISKTIDEIVEPDVLFRATVPTGATGAEALKQAWVTLVRTLPDLHVTVGDLIADDHRVVARTTISGTRLGEPVSRTEIFAVRFADGRIAEIW